VGSAPFTLLHVCLGNICRSPMAERLSVLVARELAGDRAGELVHVHSAGTGDWHVGQAMDADAARQVRRRGGDCDDFTARTLRPEHLDGCDLVLTATGEQLEYVVGLRPDVADRAFVLGQLGRLLRGLDGTRLPRADGTAEGVYARGIALVRALDTARGGRPPRRGDDLDDPWRRGDAYFERVADEIEETVRPLMALLLGGRAA
jgi:low molecular weight protein-tyrosine phosphatase